MSKKIIFGQEAREKLRAGAEIMYKAVATTLGPKGRNVAYTLPWGAPKVIHDGVTVAEQVKSKDEFENMGIDLIREAAMATNSEAGDGTTTATLLAYHLVDKGMNLLSSGVNPMVLRNQMEAALPLLIGELQKIAVKTDKQEDLERVAYISSTDETIGKLVAEAWTKAGTDGLVTVDEGKGSQTTLDFTEGMQLEKGFSSPYFVTNIQRMEAVVNNPVVIVFSKRITTLFEIAPLMDVVVPNNKNLVFIGEMGGEALHFLVDNKRKGNINCLVVDVPGMNDRREGYLSDIAALTGGQVLPDELFNKQSIEDFMEDFKPTMLGKADNIIANKKNTVITQLPDSNSRVKEQVESIRRAIDKAENEFDLEVVQERLAKLTTGVAVIRVGAKTDIEMRERVERVKDAVSAAKAALEEGVVPGGGLSFLTIASILEKSELTLGASLLFDALQEPLNKLLDNSGETDDSKKDIIEKMLKSGYKLGYNVRTGKVEDLVKAGVIDPAKVIRLSLEYAVSVAGSILSTDCLIADEFKEDNVKIV